MKKIRDLRYDIEYDFDDATETVSKVLKLHGDNNTIRCERFNYAYEKEHFSKPYDVTPNTSVDYNTN